MPFEQVGMQAVLKGAGAYLAQANAIVGSNQRITGSVSKASKASQLFGKVAGLAMKAGAIGVAVGIGAATKTFVDFDSAMTKSIAIMGDVSDALREDMETAARDVAKTTTFSMSQAADSYFFLASAGLDAKQSIEALPLVSKFAQAGAFDMARATDLLTDAQSALGLTIRDNVVKNMENMARVSDVLVKANTLANATVEQFSESLTNRAGAALKVVNKDLEEGVAVLAAFADQGIKGAEAGTRLDIVLRDLQNSNIRNREEFEKLGIEVFDSSGDLLNMAEIIGGLEDALEGMSDEQLRATLTQLGFQDRSVASLLAIIGLSDEIAVYEEELRKAGGTTDEVAEKQLTSLAAQFSLIQSAIADLLFVIGQEFEPALRGFAALLREDVIPAIERDLPRAIDKAKQLFEDWLPVIENTGNAAREIFEFLITNKVAIVATLTAIGAAMLLAFPHVAIAAAVVGIIASIGLLTANLDELGLSALRARLKLEELELSVVRGSNALFDHIFPLNLARDTYELLRGEGDKLRQTEDDLREIVNATRSAIVEQKIEMRVATSQYNETQKKIIDVAFATTDVKDRTVAWVEQMQRAVDAAATLTTTADASALAIKEIARAADEAGISVEIFVRKMLLGLQLKNIIKSIEVAFIEGLPPLAVSVLTTMAQIIQAEMEQIEAAVREAAEETGEDAGSAVGGAAAAAIEDAEDEIVDAAASIGRDAGVSFEEAFADAVSDLPGVVARVLGEIGRLAGGPSIESAEEAAELARLRVKEFRVTEKAEEERATRLADIEKLEVVLAQIRERSARVTAGLEEDLAALREGNAKKIGELEEQIAAIERQRRRILGAPEPPPDPVDVSDLVGTLDDAETKLEQFRELQRRAQRSGNIALFQNASEQIQIQQRIVDEAKDAIAARLDAEQARIEEELALKEAEFAREEARIQRGIEAQEALVAAEEIRIQAEIDALERLRGPNERRLADLRKAIDVLEDLATARKLERDLLLARVKASNALLKSDEEIVAILEEEEERVSDLTDALIDLDAETLDAVDALRLLQLGVADLVQALLEALVRPRSSAASAGALAAAALMPIPTVPLRVGEPGALVAPLPAMGMASIVPAPVSPLLSAGQPADLRGNTFVTEVTTQDSRPATIANAVRMVDIELASRLKAASPRGMR